MEAKTKQIWIKQKVYKEAEKHAKDLDLTVDRWIEILVENKILTNMYRENPADLERLKKVFSD